MDGLETADECIVGLGYATGVRGVVRRFREHTAGLQELVLRWHSEPSETAPPTGESAVHPNGIFVLELDGPDKARLTHLWPGWGRRVLAAGKPEDLRAQALRIVRRGGPFGGPAIARKGEHVVQVREPQSGTRQPLADGSEVRTLLLGHQFLGVRIWPDGRFAQGPSSASHDALGRMIEDDCEHLSFGSTHTPWTFTSMHPLVGTIRADPYDLLLCALRVDRVGLLVVQGDELLGLKVGSWDELRALDAGPWLASLAARPPPSNAKTTAEAASRKAPAAGKKTAEPSAPADKVAGEAAAPKRRKRVATSPEGVPGRRDRRVRLKAPLAEAITHHLASVASQLPAGVLGAAFAVELLLALEAAVLSDHPTLTGKTIELLSRLYKKGLLASLPGDQAGRAAVKLLAERTPLVRKIHYRRWCFAFGDIHDPASALRVRLGPLPTE